MLTNKKGFSEYLKHDLMNQIQNRQYIPDDKVSKIIDGYFIDHGDFVREAQDELERIIECARDGVGQPEIERAVINFTDIEYMPLMTGFVDYCALNYPVLRVAFVPNDISPSDAAQDIIEHANAGW